LGNLILELERRGLVDGVEGFSLGDWSRIRQYEVDTKTRRRRTSRPRNRIGGRRPRNRIGSFVCPMQQAAKQ
jgi:hypothetical protein